MTLSLPPRVSVVMPAFNSAPTIGQAISSVLAQTLRALEVIVCDDASTDNTAEIVQSFRDERVRLVRNASRLGAGESRNIAIDAARAPWIAVLDADDAIHPSRLERMLDATRQDALALVFDDILECRHSDQGLVPLRRMRGERAFGATGSAIAVDTPSWIRTERLLIKPLFNAGFVRDHGIRHTTRGYAEDTEYFLAMAGAGARLTYVPDPFYYYRKTPNSASSSPHRHRDMLDVLGKARAIFRESPLALEALGRRAGHERRLEDYFALLRSLRQARFRDAVRICVTRPGVVKELLVRTGRELPYRLHPGKTCIKHGSST